MRLIHTCAQPRADDLTCRRSKRKFNDESVCKYYLCGFCPYEVRPGDNSL